MNKRKTLNKSGNRLLHGFIIFALLGYGIFFSSKLWLKAPYEGVPVTPIGKTVTEEDRSVTINSWKYSKKQKMMEIMVNVENLSLDGIDTYEWSVKTSSSTLKTAVVLDSKDLVVIKVRGVPRHWAEAALIMELKNKDKSKNSDFKILKLYTNEKHVKFVKMIKNKSTAEYKEEQISAIIQGYKEQLKTLKKAKKETTSAIENADKKIGELTDDMKYQTSSEQMKTGERIAAITAEKESLIDSLESKNTEIEEIKEKVKIQEALIKK